MSKKDISYLVGEIESIFRPFAYHGSQERIEKLLIDYKALILEEVESRRYAPYIITKNTSIDNK